GDLPYSVSHVLDSQRQEALLDILRRYALSSRATIRGQTGRQFIKERSHHLGDEGLNGGRREYGWKMADGDHAEQYIRIRDRQWPAAAVTCRPRIRAGRVWTGPVAPVGVAQQGSASRGDRVNLHHGCTETYAGNFRIVAPLILAAEGGNIGGRASHVETDQAPETCRSGRSCHPYDAGRGPRQDAVLAAESIRGDETAVALHEHQAR